MFPGRLWPIFVGNSCDCKKAHLCFRSETGRKEQEMKPGLRSIKLSSDGLQLASGDRMGNIR